MEKWTILKANIRHKKGSFAGIVILMAVISMVLLSLLGVWDNISAGITDAQERGRTGDVLYLINKNRLEGKLLSDVRSHPLVKDVKTVETLICDNMVYQDYKYSNPVFLQEVRKSGRLFHSGGTGYQDKTPELKPGELYISRGTQTNMGCRTGDTVSFTFSSGTYRFKIAGIMEDPEFGASVIGWKNVFISKRDYDKICKEVMQTDTPEQASALIMRVLVYKTDDCKLSDVKFARQLNLDTGISDMGIGSLARSTLTNYTSLFPKIICMVLTVFALLLLAAVIIVVCHSVSTGIEMEYTVFGIMKALGFQKRDIQVILAAQYLLAEAAGILLGVLPAVPLCYALGNIFWPITGIVPRKAISIEKGGLLLLLALAVSVLCIAVIMRKIKKITPVAAILGGKNEIYFDSRIKIEINKKMLSSTLAFRQFTSNKKQYAGMAAIAAILVYFMTSMMILTNMVNVRSSWSAMGIMDSNLDIYLSSEKEVTEEQIKEIEKTIGENGDFRISYKYCGNYNLSLDGEQMMCSIFEDVQYIPGLLKGRLPEYENEIVITEIAAETLDLKIGDKVTVVCKEKKAEYMISGLNQHVNDAGMNFSMTMEAASRIMKPGLSFLGYIIEDETQGEKTADILNKKYGDFLSAEYDDQVDVMYQAAVYAMTLVVYLFSAVFAVVVVHMICSRAFIRERRDIGIYKALGFTSKKLRLQFAIRFAIVAGIGAVAGCAAAAVFAGNMLGRILRLIGISQVDTVLHVSTILVPVIMICMCFFLFSYMASRKIKRVEVRELVTE